MEGYVVTRTNDAGAVPCTRTCWIVTPVGEAPAGNGAARARVCVRAAPLCCARQCALGRVLARLERYGGCPPMVPPLGSAQRRTAHPPSCTNRARGRRLAARRDALLPQVGVRRGADVPAVAALLPDERQLLGGHHWRAEEVGMLCGQGAERRHRVGGGRPRAGRARPV
eukprot:5350174-Prymnesium_polylepis.1